MSGRFDKLIGLVDALGEIGSGDGIINVNVDILKWKHDIQMPFDKFMEAVDAGVIRGTADISRQSGPGDYLKVSVAVSGNVSVIALTGCIDSEQLVRLSGAAAKEVL